MGSCLVLSDETKGAPLAYRLCSEGAVVRMLFENLQYTNSLLRQKNLTVITSLQMLDQYDLILDTGTKSSEFVNAEGYTTIGGGSFGKRLNEDPSYHQRVLRLTDVAEPTSEGYQQEPIHKLLTGWFHPEAGYLLFTTSEVWDHLCEGQKGPYEPHMARATTLVDEPPKQLLGLEPLLRKINYHGPITLELCPNRSLTTTFFPLEILELYRGSAFDFLLALKRGEQPTLRRETAICLKLYYKGDETTPLLTPEPAAVQHFFYQDATSEGVWAPPGTTLAWVTARSDQPLEARRRALRTIKRSIRSKYIQYLTDVGRNHEKLAQA